MIKVAVSKVDSFDYTYSDVEKAMNEALALIGGIEKYINLGERVLIKPNMLEAVDKGTGVTTHPEVVRAVIREVRKAGGVPVLGDSPAMGHTVRTAEKTGILAVCREEDVPVLPFEELVEISSPMGIRIKKFTLAKELTEVDKVISVAKMKTHSFTGITGAIKNLFGFVVGTDKAQFHLRMQRRQDFAAMLVDLAQTVKPVLFIVDGIVGMEGHGPRNGDPIKVGVMLAGDNGFAVDMVMARVMGFVPERLPVNALALEKGLVPAFKEIEVAGSGKEVVVPFKPSRNIEALEDRIPSFIARLGRRQLTAKPLIEEHCVGCGRCAEHCPPKAMRVENGKVKINYKKCIRCYCCQELCPQNAVKLEEGMTLRLAKKLLKTFG